MEFRPQRGIVEAIGAEVMEIVDGKIKEIRDYHLPVDLDEMLPEKVSQRIAAASFPVERVRSHLN